MYKYETIIYWSNEDDAFIAEVPELPEGNFTGKEGRVNVAFS